MANALYIPFINPVRFYDPNRAVTDKYQTPHFDDFLFAERLLQWQTPADYLQVWQTTDIIYLQFESTFDPIVVDLVDQYGSVIITLPALVGLPNFYYANTYSYEVSMSLATVATGCYRLRITAGTVGGQKVYWSGWQYISAEKIPGTVLMEYYHNKFHEDVMFETGIKYQFRVFAHLGALKPGRSDERYKDQRYNPSLLSSRSYRQFDFVTGDEFGVPDDVIDLLNRIWGCSTVLIDGKSFAVADGQNMEFVEVEDFPKRGVKLVIEEGNNRASKILSQEVDETKKLTYGIVVDAKVWGDTSNQGSSNVVPINDVE